MRPEQIYQAKIDELNDKKTKLMQEVILLVDQVGKIDTEIEKLEKEEANRVGIQMIKQITNETHGNMIVPNEPNLN